MMSLARIAQGGILNNSALNTNVYYSTHFGFGSVGLEVKSTSLEAAVYLQRVYSFFLRVAKNIAEQPLLTIVIVEEGTRAHQQLPECLAVPRRLAGHVLITNWLDWAFCLRNKALLNYYASKLLRLRVVEVTASEVATLHGAAVSHGKCGVLLIGEAASGKTSLTLKLLELGFKYCADDTTPIRRRDLHCLPFPTPLMTRSLGMSTSRVHNRPPDVVLAEEPRWLVDYFGSVADEFRPTHIFFLQSADLSDAGRPRNIRPVSQIEAVIELMRNTVLPLGDTAQIHDLMDSNLNAYADLVSMAECYILPSENLDIALKGILERVGGYGDE